MVEELIAACLNEADAADVKLLIEKGVITETESLEILAGERANYLAVLKRMQ